VGLVESAVTSVAVRAGARRLTSVEADARRLKYNDKRTRGCNGLEPITVGWGCRTALRGV
jgi:hypothetical protein